MAKTQKQPAAELAPVEGSEAAYQKFLAVAKALDPAAIVPLRGDVQLAYQNAAHAVHEVLGASQRVKDELPKVDLAEVATLTELALGTLFAAAQVDRRRGSDGAIAKLLAQSYPLRHKLLSSAEALAAAGILSAPVIEGIRRGQGRLDASRDLVDLAALFRRNADKVKGKSPVAAADLSLASQLGSQLLALLKPARTRTPEPDEVKAAVDARDRLWTLLVGRYETLRRAAMWLWGEEADEHVPPLQSRLAAPKKKRPAPGAESPPAAAAPAA